MDRKELSEVYSYAYTAPIPGKGLYGWGSNRDGLFIKWISANLPPGLSVFEAGCGRGLVLKWLLASGYQAEGIDIADSLFEPGGDLYNQPAKKMFIEDLHQIESDSFDVTISNDVLEHMLTEEIAIQAVSDLVRISRRWVLLSVAVRAAAWPFANYRGFKPHTTIRAPSWWLDLFRTHCDVLTDDMAGGTYLLFGTKRK